MYHQIDDAPRKGASFRSLYVAPGAFARQMGLLRFLGYRGLSMTALMPYLTGAKRGRVVGITFDDGYLNTLHNALPVLKTHGFSSTCYAVSQRLGQSNDWDQEVGMAFAPLMSAAQLREWVAGGQEVGAHTRHHLYLPQLTDAECNHEITACQTELQEAIGSPVRHFCYPFGGYCYRHADMVEQAGYATATTTTRARCQVGDDLWQLPRVTVVRSTMLALFWIKLATTYEDRHTPHG